jgi:hypothetical protein
MPLTGHKVVLAIDGVEREIQDSTTDADLELFIQATLSSTSAKPVHLGRVQEVKETGMMVPPFQFNPLNNSIVSSTGFQVPLPCRLAYVLKAMLQHDPLNPKSRRSYLSLTDVARSYKEGWIDDYHGSSPQADKDAELTRAEDEIVKDPGRLVHAFSSELSEELGKNGIGKKLIFWCDRVNKCYRLGTGWHPTKPILFSSEPGMFSVDDPEKFRRLPGKRGGSRLQDEQE